MGKRWEEMPEKNGIPQWKLTVSSDTPGDGVVPSVYRGTKDQIADALADSQQNANRRLAELRNGSAGHTAPPPAPPRPQTLSPEQRMQTVAEMNDPATVDKAVLRIVESAVGPMENLRQASENAPAEREERSTRAAVEAASRFTEETPEWHPSEYNKSTLVGFMRTQGLSPNLTAHYHQAFDELTAAQLLQPKPEEPENETQPPDPQPERNAPAPALPRTPARTSTGFRSSDASGSAPKPTARMKYTREQIANMSAATYKHLMTSEPEFVRCTEFYAQQDARPRRRTG